MIAERFKRRVRSLRDRFSLRFEVRSPRPEWAGERDRFAYQHRYVTFDVRPGDRVLDVGSGGKPFPLATVLADLSLESSKDRLDALARDDRPLVLADIHNLPFDAKSFDYVYCSHVLEHVVSPLRACAELMRVGRRGFIETPMMAKDALFAWARGMHRWHMLAIGDNLCFFEYSPRQLEGIRSSVWRDLVFDKWHNPLQEVFYENQDLFNVMFTWSDRFGVFAFYLSGTVESLNARVLTRRVVAHPRSNPG